MSAMIILAAQLRDLECRLAALEARDDPRVMVSTGNVSSVPTDAELDAAFGTPAGVGAGFIGLVDDAGAGTAVWLVASDGSNWWYELLSKAL